MTQRNTGAWSFLWPWALGVTLLTLLPLGASLALSFSATRMESGALRFEWAGAKNFADALAVDRSAEPTADDIAFGRLLGGRPHDPRF